MFRWAIKSLFSQPGSFIGSALGIASAFILVIFFDAVWRGETVQIVAYPDHMKPDVWVMQSGVGNMHMAMSFVWDWKADEIARMPEVERVTPILYLNTVIVAGSTKTFAFIVGQLPDDERAGPWALSAGRRLQNSDEVIVPDVFARISGAGIGDIVQIADKRFTIVGLSQGTFSSANTVLFVPFSDLEDVLSSTGTYSYLLVDAKPGVSPEALANKIRNEVQKVNALTHDQFIKNDYAMAKQMGVELIIIMTIICSTLAALIVGFTAYSLVMRKRQELAIAKALGMHNYSILAGVLLQSVLVTLTGFILAAAFAVFVIPYIPALVPQITVSISAGALMQLASIALLVACIGAFVPAYIVARMDPASVFHS